MNSDSNKISRRPSGATPASPVSPSIRAGIGLAALACAGAAALLWSRHPVPQSGSLPPSRTESVATDSTAVVASAHDPTPSTQPAVGIEAADSPAKPQPAIEATTPLPAAEPSADSRRLVEALVKSGVNPTPEAAGEWREMHRKLVQLGAAAVPAIREYLAKNTEQGFGDGKSMLGYPSARLALFDALGQIGGPEAVRLMLDTAASTAEPREIATLARDIETAAPGQHRQEILGAALDVIGIATKDQLPGADVAPLFEVLQQYGGTGTVADLEKTSNKWGYYAAVALAGLPEGAGIPSLVRMVREGTAPGAPALAALAQAAGDSPEARDALLDQIRQNRVSPYAWATITPILGGSVLRFTDSVLDPSLVAEKEVQSFHIQYNNQNFYHSPNATALPPDRLRERITFIDTLMSATSDPVTVAGLTSARTTLTRALDQITAVTPPGN